VLEDSVPDATEVMVADGDTEAAVLPGVGDALELDEGAS
jgi:hypothetical protein